MSNIDKADNIGFGERECPTCRKVFLVTTPLRQYAYKIVYDARRTDYFCCYTHYKAGQEKMEQKKAHNKEAYKQRIANKRRL